MRPETRRSMEMLFAAKWNLPKAAKNAGLTNKEMKITFNEYCTFHPPTYEGEWFFGSVVESVDTPDLKSVDHYGRGSSSLPTRTLSKIKWNSAI